MWRRQRLRNTPLTPSPKPFIQAQGGACRLAGQTFLNPLRSSDTADAAHREAEWTSGRLHALLQPETLRILPLRPWRADPGRAGFSHPADSTMRPTYAPAEATGRRRPPPRDSDTRPAMLVQGTVKTAWIFPLSDESAFQTIHPRFTLLPMWFV